MRASSSPEWLLPKLLNNARLVLDDEFLAPYQHYGNGGGIGHGDSASEWQTDMHGFGRDTQDEGDGLGEGRWSWGGTSTFYISGSSYF